MKEIRMDFKTYTKELGDAEHKGFMNGIDAACDTIRELLEGETNKNLLHFDGCDENDIKIIDKIINAMEHKKALGLKNPLKGDTVQCENCNGWFETCDIKETSDGLKVCGDCFEEMGE